MSLVAWLPWSRRGTWFGTRVRGELQELYLFSLFFSFAFSLITIFEPVFLYQQGIPLSGIALYYALHYTIYVVLLPLGGKFAARFGLERSLALSAPLFVFYFLTLAALPSYPTLIWAAIVLLTIHKIFYWPAYHADFAKFTNHRNSGTEVSWMSLITYGTGIAGPLVGGVIAGMFGFPALFILAAITVLLAGLPLLMTRERYRITDMPYSKVWDIIRHRQHRRMVITMAGMGEELIHLVFWPIFLFVILGSVERLGVVAAVAVAIMTLWGFVIGELADRYSARRVLRLSVPFLMLANVSRQLVMAPVGGLLADVVIRITNVGVRTPMLARLYHQAKRHGELRYALAFETTLAVAKAITAWGLVWVFATFAPELAFSVTFWLAVVLAILYAAL